MDKNYVIAYTNDKGNTSIWAGDRDRDNHVKRYRHCDAARITKKRNITSKIISGTEYFAMPAICLQPDL